MKKLLITLLILIATPVSAKMLWEYGDFNERAKMAVDNGVVSNVSEYKGTYGQNVNLLDALENTNNLGASTQPAALTTYNLAGSGVSSSATSITLQSLTIPQNDYKIQDSDLSDTFYITLEPGSKVRQEIVSCTTVAQNVGGTATLSGCTRGLSPITPYTASSTLQFSHAGGSQVIFSDPPQLFNLYPAKANSETITGPWTYTILPESSLTATTSNQFATKTYVDNVSNQGAATSSESVAGIIEQATNIETASGTAFDANNPHTINSEMATSTPGSNAGLQVVVSENDGKINQGWIDLSENFIFTGENTNTGTSTMATTTITDLTTGTSTSVTTNQLVNLTNGTNADVLHTHETAKLLVSTTTPATYTKTGDVNIFASSTLAANLLETDGVLHARVFLSRVDIDNTKTCTFSFQFGTETFGGLTITNSTGGDLSVEYTVVDAYVIASGATNTQKGYMIVQMWDDSETLGAANINAYRTSFTTTMSQDTTSAVVFAIYANQNNADIVTSQGGYVEIIN